MDDDIELQIPPEKDLSGTVFHDPGFFRLYPRLNEQNAMLYFSASPFFETSNNLNSLMKTQLISDPQAVSDFLKRSRGYFYELAGAPIIDPQNPQQPIWLIAKKFSFGSEGDGEMKDIGLYYIYNNQIFQAPLWKNVAGSKLWQTAVSTQQMLSEFWAAKEAISDVKREMPLSDRKEDNPMVNNAFKTLERQFELQQRRLQTTNPSGL